MLQATARFPFRSLLNAVSPPRLSRVVKRFRTMPISKEWRQFEQLVARIEATASARGAVVKSPDRIRDLVTGQMREVDATMRYREGTVDMLVTIECRKRSRKADDTWIEQLATKRVKIGAAKTIAVSSNGFSESAHKTARCNSIELRTLSEVSPSDIETWFLPGGAVQVFRLIEDVHCEVFLRRADGTPETEAFTIKDSMAHIFHHKHIPSPFPAVLLFESMEMWDPKIFWGTPLDGSKVRYVVPFKGGVTVDTEGGNRPIHHGTLSGTISYQSAVCPLESGIHHRYTSKDGEIAQHTAFNKQLMGLPFEFNHQATKDGLYASFQVREKPKKPDE